ncbi:glycoside hydrolase family 16 protein [Geodermatophilus arenarius]|uniref:Family 16 glycosylhydrolase n=1 Tax=Geodermatophilus arenarius TaxID=1137990 RepID=A0ABV9LK37_9ACTN
MPSRKQVLVLSAVAVVAAVAAVVLVVVRGADPPRVTASSGTDPSALVAGAPDPGDDDVERDVYWRTDSETVGAWVELTYPEPTSLDHVEVLGPGGGETGPASALLTFDGGASLLVTTDDEGDASVTFPERTASRVRVTIAGVPDGATSVALAGLSVDGSADDPPRRGADRAVVATASTPADRPVEALTDGTPADGDTGEEWTADADDDAPWVSLSWNSPREIASVQVFGPSAPGGESLSGVLRFDDGSTVRVPAIARGGGEATTIAVAPRMASGVRLELDRPDGAVSVGLRELAVYDAGTTPPRWPQDWDGYATAPPAVEPCDAEAEPVGEAASGRLGLVCPAVGSAVDGRTDVVVAADPGTTVEARVWTGVSGTGTNAVDVVARATADEDGLAVLPLDLASAPRGPVTVRVDPVPDAAATDEDLPTSLYVQLYNRAGRDLTPDSTAPEGMTLQWAEEFDRPLSVSATGAGADYAAVKPDASSSGQFGDAPFADPASDDGTLTTLDDQYLRIRTQPAQGAGDQDGTDNVAGLLASTDVDGAGFIAQYGYFEARILGAPGAGTWPAFWMLDAESAARPSDTSTEVDTVELYGHDTLGSCHTVHDWGSEEAGEPGTGAPSCNSPNGFTDWAIAWHTYAARITPDGAAFTIDGQVVASADSLTRTTEPFFFLLDLALGGGWPVDLAPTGGVSDTYVDWVRVWT